jgi:hypothetical protein
MMPLVKIKKQSQAIGALGRKKLLIACPCHNGKLDNTFALSLLETVDQLAKAGIETTVLLPPTGSVLTHERNKIISVFMQNTDATHILCIDSDMGWDPGIPLRMLKENRGIIAGCYPARSNLQQKNFLFVPKTNPDGSLVVDKNLVQLNYGPAGFMMISREAITTMQAAFPERHFHMVQYDGTRLTGTVLFNTEIIDGGAYIGEDYLFCHLAGLARVDIWTDPSYVFTHAGTTGALASILVQK